MKKAIISYCFICNNLLEIDAKDESFSQNIESKTLSVGAFTSKFDVDKGIYCIDIEEVENKNEILEAVKSLLLDYGVDILEIK